MAYRTVYPYTNEVLQTYDPATDAELEQALAAGHALYKQWRDADPAPRARILRQIAARLRAKRTEYATIMTHDMGKLIGESEDEIDLCAAIADYYAEHGPAFLQPQPLRFAAGLVSINP